MYKSVYESPFSGLPDSKAQWKTYCRIPVLCLAMGMVMIFSACEIGDTAGEKNGSQSPCEMCGPEYFSMQAFPRSSNYPVSSERLNGWVHRRDGHQIRIHGWHLFAGLMETVKSKRGTPVWLWQTWPTATQAFRSEGISPLGATGGTRVQETSFLLAADAMEEQEKVMLDPPGYRVPASVCKMVGLDSTQANGCDIPVNGCQFQNNGDVMIAGVIYNPPAYRHIRGKKLYDWNTLVSMWTRSHDDPKWQNREIPQFPDSSIVLKPMLWPVKQTGYTPLPVFPVDCYYDRAGCDTVNGKVQYSGFEIQRVWDKAVAITPDSNPADSVVPEIKFLYDVFTDDTYSRRLGPNTYKNAEVHSLDEFYHWQVGEEEWQNMNCVDKAIISQSAYWAYGEAFKPGDYLVLVAMHIITKEMPAWTFQSVWWDNTEAGRNSKFVHQRDSVHNPPEPSAFSGYLMTSTYGMNAKNENPAEWPVAFNPFIELAAAHPIQTNCRNCHQRGAFPNKMYRDQVGKNLKKYASYLYPGDGYPNTLDTFSFNNAVLDSLLIMDYQWAITDRVTPPSSGNGYSKKN